MSDTTKNLRQLKVAALISAVVHTLGAFAMAIVLSPGLLPGLLTPRMDYIRDNLLAWQCGWWLWVLSALAFLVFILTLKIYYCALAVNAFNKRLLSFAVAFVAIAVCFDLLFEYQQIFSVPIVINIDRKEFSTIQIGFLFFSGVIANFWYSSATIASVIAIRSYFPAWINFLGWATAAIGLAASGSALITTFLELAHPSIVFNTVLFPLLIFWQLGIALNAKNNVKLQLEPEADT